jgi:hypothetical protein
MKSPENNKANASSFEIETSSIGDVDDSVEKKKVDKKEPKKEESKKE